MKQLVIVVLVFLLIALGFFLTREAQAPIEPVDTETATATDPVSEDPVTDAPTGTEFTSDPVEGIRFSLRLPESVETSRLTAGLYEFTYIGPESEPNTEITDGYYMSVQVATGTGGLTEYATKEAVGDVTNTTLAGRDAVRYETISALNEQSVTHVVVQVSEYDLLLDFAYTTHGEAASQYEMEVVEMIQSFSVEMMDQVDHIESKADLIRVTAPMSGEDITSPVTVIGEARGNWFFEGDFPILITDWDGRIIGEHFATAEEDWMTEDFVPFRAEVEFESPYSESDPEFMSRGTLILQRSNPSGLPENDDALEIPIRFSR